MIAGSHTPFALCALNRNLSIPLLVAAWVVAVLVQASNYGLARAMQSSS
jgi:predicted membrane channel-forming protein YqfA (hemolysin III family)